MMLNLIISTVVFFIAARLLNRYLDEQGVPKGMGRALTVMALASLMSWGVCWTLEWTQSGEGNFQSSASGGVSQILGAASQEQR
jgi:hypothetical protein